MSETTATKGEIVLVSDDTPRSTWKMGRNEELYQKNDGREKSAQVKRQGRENTRDFRFFYLLEMTT